MLFEYIEVSSVSSIYTILNMQIGQIITYTVLVIQILLTFCVSSLGTSLLPLYYQDPHDLQHPTLPPPECTVPVEDRFDIDAVIQIIAAFCIHENEVISATNQRTIFRTYTNKAHTVQFALSWSNTGICQRSFLQMSPSQGSGENCKRIFCNILLRCEACLSGPTLGLNFDMQVLTEVL